jgi:hypothetical protein
VITLKIEELIFFRDDEKAEIRKQDKETKTDIRLLHPYITKSFKGVIQVDDMLNDEMYFEVLAPDDPNVTPSYYVFMDGTKYLPVKIQRLVLDNSWRCIAIRNIASEAKDKYSEFIHLAIFYEKSGKFIVENGNIAPYGPHADIFVVCTLNGDVCESYYKVSFNGHLLFVAGDHNFGCSFESETRRLGLIDFVDNRGVNFLHQCLFCQKH